MAERSAPESTEGLGECYRHPALHPPSIHRVAEIAKSLKLDLTDEELKEYRDAMADSFKEYQKLYDLVEPKLPVKYPRTPGYRPTVQENQLNAWYWKCDIAGASSGKLHGKTIAIKDSIPVAGVPMMNGSQILEGFIPDIDATVVTRVLDQGGRILGKATCEDLCMDSNSFTSATGPVRHPFNPSKMAGGSSSGCAVLVAKGEVDMAIGGDQGGSIRMPAAICGIVGLKPTFGLVPYTGIPPQEITVDHTGPMARSVYDTALLLETIAGLDDDGLDPRQPTLLKIPEYSKQLTGNIKGLRIGLVKEGFEVGCEPDVKELVRNSAERLREVGALVEEVSIPWHNYGSLLLSGIYVGLPIPYNCTSMSMYYDTHLQLAMERGMKMNPNALSPCITLSRLEKRYFQEDYPGRILHGKAQNLRRELKKAYNEVLQRYDVLIMPTVTKKASNFPPKNPTLKEFLEKAGGINYNTVVSNLTGHPALTINAGLSKGLSTGQSAGLSTGQSEGLSKRQSEGLSTGQCEGLSTGLSVGMSAGQSVGLSAGLPVGMMIVGKMFDESTVLNVAYAYEQLRDNTECTNSN